MRELPRIEFSREIIGTPENCKRAWIAFYVLSNENISSKVSIWQDGAWWCMQVEYGNVLINTTWGNASHIMQELQMFGHVAGLDHIDFNRGNLNA